MESLKGSTHTVIPDRIEAGTYAVASLISNGKITLNRVDIKAMKNIFNVLKLSGAKLKFNKKNSVTVSRKKIKSLNPVEGFFAEGSMHEINEDFDSAKQVYNQLFDFLNQNY